jgi:two-component system sensor histidine kinase/response regulator
VSARSRRAGYGISVAVLAVVLALRWLVIPEWSLSHPYLLFYPAIILAGWYGGFGPGILATLVGAVALAYLWMPPFYSLRIRDIRDATAVLVFVAVGFAISLLSEARRRADARAKAAEHEAQRARERP